MTAPPDDDITHEYEVDRILGHQRRQGKDYYYIHWKGYPSEDDTWEPKENISKAALTAWEQQNKRQSNQQKRRRHKQF